MKSVEIEVFPRSSMTKNELGRFRAQGSVPAILYGKHIEQNVPLSFVSKSFTKLLSTHGRASIFVFKSSDSKLNGTSALVKDIQKDPVTDVLLNVDLIEIRKDEKITVKVPIEFVGEAAGAKQGGVVDVQRRELEIECLPTNIPDKITVDVSKLELNDVLHVSDLKLGEGIEILDDGSYALVSVRIVKEKVVETVTAATAEGAEGVVAAEGVAAATGAAPGTAPGVAPGAAPGSAPGVKAAPGAAPTAPSAKAAPTKDSKK